MLLPYDLPSTHVKPNHYAAKRTDMDETIIPRIRFIIEGPWTIKVVAVCNDMPVYAGK